MDKSDFIPVVVTIQDDALSRIDGLADELKERGMVVDNVLHAAGAVMGSVAREAMAALASIPGVEDVEEVREVRALG